MRQLTEFFAIAARQYAEVAVKFGHVGPHPQDFAQLVQITEQARRRTEEAFAALKRHARDHRCVQEQAAAAGS